MSNTSIIADQYRLRKNKSTADALLHCARTLQAFNEEKCVLDVFIDFRKAFDTINHKILLQKLEDIGFNGLLIKWFLSYLTHRQYVTKINEIISSEAAITCGGCSTRFNSWGHFFNIYQLFI